jgi:hypothetical protein
MNRDNQPVFNTDRKVVNFKNFSKDVEKEKLGKIRRSFQPNSDRQNFTTNDRNEFDPITRKVTQVTLPEVEDKIDAIEQDKEKNENKSFTDINGNEIPEKLRLAYQKWIESEHEDYFGGDRDQELRMKAFMKELDGYSSSETRSKFIKALDSQYGEIPKRFRSHFLR